MKPLACCCALGLGIAALARAEDVAPPPAAEPARLRVGAYASYWDVPRLEGLGFDGTPGGGLVGNVRLGEFFDLELRLSCFATRDSMDTVSDAGEPIDNEVTIVFIPLEADVLVRLPLGNKLCLYGGPGVGAYLFDGQSDTHKGSDETIYDVEVEDEFGGYVLAGLRFQMSDRIAAIAEGKYTWIKTSIEKATDAYYDIGIDWVAQDLDFSGPSLNLGLIFTL